MSLHLFDAVFRFIRTGCHLIMEGVYVTIWTEQMDWSSRWLPRSHDLFPVFFFLGSMKSIVYNTAVNSEIDQVARISLGAAAIHETPGIFKQVCQSMSHRYCACIHDNGRNLEHLLSGFYISYILFIICVSVCK